MNNKQLAVGFIGSLLTASHSAIALAESAGLKEETTVITASRTAETVSSLPQTVQVIDQAQIVQQSQSGQSLNDILPKLIPGLGAGSETSTNATQTLRGRSVLILIDGVSQYDNRQVSRTLSTIPVDMIERIEVVSGATAIYGAGGAGGVINVITKQPSDEALAFETRLGAAISTEELSSDSTTYNFNQIVSGTQNEFSYLVSLGGEIRNNLYDADGNRIAPEPAQSSRGDSDSFNSMVKLGYQIDTDRALLMTAEWAQEEQDTDYGPDYGGAGVPVILAGEKSSGNAVGGYSASNQPKKERLAVTLDFSDQELFGSVFRGQAFYREREFSNYGFALNTGVSRTVRPIIEAMNGFAPGTLPDVLFNAAYPQHRDLAVFQSKSEATVYGTKLTFETPIAESASLIWGADYSMDKGTQTAQSYDSEVFYNSAGLTFTPVGNSYDYGPEVETETKAVFTQVQWDATDDLTIRSGIRFEDVNVDVKDTLPTFENLYWSNYGDILALLAPTGGPVAMQGAELDYDTWLFNAGAIYRINNNHELFANYSEGFELPDTSRLLRNAIAENSALLAIFGVPSGMNVSTDVKLDAVEVQNYELGWRGNWQRVNAAVTAFYNQSDKTPVFNPDYTVDLLDQDKTIYGIESLIDIYVTNSIQVGGTYAYTQGETKIANGKDMALGANEVAPSKLTTYVQYNQPSYSARLQSLTIFDYDDAHQDDASAADIEGYTTLDLLTQVEVGPGNLQVNIGNLLNEDYKTVYGQWAEATYGSASGINAAGRSLALSYHMVY